MESMPEYRRFIAYFYEYIDGKKMNNVGFAKVELRSGMWRILFRLTAVHSPEPPVQVYGFVREKEYLLGLLMGTMRCGNQMLEEWAYRADTPIWKQQYGFSDLAGIWIQCGDGHRYVTVWDDDPIEINRFVLELPDKWDVKRTEVGGNSETGEFVENSRKDGREPMTESENVQTEHIEKRAEKSEKEKRYAAAAKEGQKLSQYADGDAGKEAAAAGGAMDYVEAAQLAEDGIYTELSRRSTPPSPCDAIIQRREAFEPFGDTQFEACFKILPCDLIALQQAGWQVGRSSFLLHGFYQYHHLLLARKADGSFVLGVPGLQNPQECYMAQTFGFPDFKTAKWKDHGRPFGYYYKEGPAKREDSL